MIENTSLHVQSEVVANNKRKINGSLDSLALVVLEIKNIDF